MQSICIGVHVHAEPVRLRATLESLRRNTRQTFDLLLLPDGPDDATRVALNALHNLPQSATADPLGPPTCFNRLVTSTTAEIVILLESGILVGPDWLDYLLAALATDPRNGLAGPSTNRSWNEQAVFPRSDGTPAEVVRTAQQAAQRFGYKTRTLEPLYSLGDFCYVVRREVIQTIGMADESYGLGPCWEMDYNIRAARAGFYGVWACGAYVYRAPFTARRQREERWRFEISKHLYQDRFCGLRLRGEKTSYEPHCRGEACEHFAPRELVRITLPLGSRSQLPIVKENNTNNDDTSINALDEHIQIPPEVDPKIHLLMLEHIHQRTNDLPLISCVMPTRNRRVFVRQALAYFERQDYPNRELIIVDDGEDRIFDLLPSADPCVRYVALPRQTSIGEKRNIACEQARGAIIVHWDDDDWCGPHRLQYQVAPLLEKKADMTGLETACFFDLTNWQAWVCTPELHRRLFVGDVHGGTLAYWRWIWERLARYRPLSLAEDAFFLQQACQRGARLDKLPHANSFVYIRHGSNAWSFPLGSYLQPSGWKRTDVSMFLPAADLSFYAALSPSAPASLIASSFFTDGEARGGENEPLISCIMPTHNRRAFVAQSISYFLRQDYTNKELIIVDDGTDPIGDLIPTDERIRYIRLHARSTIGAKRNLACEQARGSVIAHWDDDDWHAPLRLRYQVEALLLEGIDLCGISSPLFYEMESGRAWQYVYPKGQKVWLSGSTLCYKRTFWASNRFANINVGEDARFVWGNRPERMTTLGDATFHVGMIHKQNVSPKKTNGAYWHPYPVEEIRCLLGVDWSFYQSHQKAT